ncbi:MAG: cyclic nucleotide-binding domain-containing protein [Thermodesulfovibrionia bacterium]|nr:cyclic nucleotide-binding domain-containing protein [Thermodesulfovibrionia bacterium]
MKNLSNEELLKIKAEINVFRYLSEEDIKEISGYFKIKSAAANSIIWKEFSPCDYVAFILSGSVKMTKETEFKGKEIVFGIYKKGATIGALCILDRGIRPVTAVALEDVSLVLITREDFDELIEKYPRSGARLLKGMLLSLSMRLRCSYDRMTSVF